MTLGSKNLWTSVDSAEGWQSEKKFTQKVSEGHPGSL